MAAQDINEFDLARQRAQDESNANLQRQKDALTRRFAQLGNLNSGARLKMEQQATTENQRQLGDTNQSIGAAERTENRRVQEIKDARDFTREERLGSQDFSSQQAGIWRQFATSERLGGQDYASQQAGIGRQFATSERLGGQQFSGDQAALTRAVQQNQFNKTFAEGQRQYNQGAQFQAGRAKQADKQFAMQFNQGLDAAKQTQKNFDATFNEEARINNQNIDFAKQALNQKGFFDKIAENPLVNNFAFFKKGAKGGDIGTTVTSWFN